MEMITLIGFAASFLRDLSAKYPQFHLDFWLIFGFAGQIMFTMRFIVQWIASEKRKESVIPVSFWYLSLAGGLIVLFYAIHRMDPVFIVAYLPGNFIYFRNLCFIYKKKKASLSFTG
ncbi:MAG: lipid-A-disaccharide synthase N-terminal domain-containing protein [Thermodesulfobacteriota bacterium]